MKERSDSWYVRLPDGRVLRADSTSAVRHHVGAGRIPLESRVRRTADEEWAGLEWTQEFADLVRERAAATTPTEPSSLDLPAALAARSDASSIAARLDPMRLQTVGVRGYVEELVGALDSTLVRNKLKVAAVGGLLAALLVVLLEIVWGLVPDRYLWAGGGLALLLIAVVCSCLLTQMCYVELCKLRPARWAEARVRLGWNVLNLLLAWLPVVGGALLGIYGLRRLPAWLLVDSPWPAQPGLREALTDVAAGAGVILEVALCFVLVFSLLLPPVVVVEECSFVRALGQWLGLLRHHVSRTFLYEALAVVPALVVTTGLLLPVQWATRAQTAELIAAGARGEAEPGTQVIMPHRIVTNWVEPVHRLLQGVAVAPMTAFLAVANVFIYLNLRYEHEPRRR
jgi:hypothetical protein